MAGTFLREVRLALDEALRVGQTARDELTESARRAMITWRSASQAAEMLKHAVVTDGRTWFVLADDDATADGANDTVVV